MNRKNTKKSIRQQLVSSLLATLLAVAIAGTAFSSNEQQQASAAVVVSSPASATAPEVLPGTTPHHPHIAASNSSTAAVSSCSCVIYRLDDIQGQWISDVQNAVLTTFVQSNTKLTPGLITNDYGNDTSVVANITAGVNAGLFEVALHGWDHLDYSSLPESQQESTLGAALAKVQSMHGVTTNIFITPYNVFNSDTVTAMQHLGLNIISAGVDTPAAPIQNFPPADPSTGISSIPATVWYTDDTRPTGHFYKSAEQLRAEIKNSIAVSGYAVVMLHPQDFSNYDNKGVAQNVVNQTELGNLQTLMSDVNADGWTIASFNDLAQSSSSSGGGGPDTVPPTVDISSPSDGDSVPTNSTITVTGDASDDVAVALVQVRMVTADNSTATNYVTATYNSADGTWSANLPPITNPAFTQIQALATDTSGNQATTTVTVNIA